VAGRGDDGRAGASTPAGVVVDRPELVPRMCQPARRPPPAPVHRAARPPGARRAAATGAIRALAAAALLTAGRAAAQPVAAPSGAAPPRAVPSGAVPSGVASAPGDSAARPAPARAAATDVAAAHPASPLGAAAATAGLVLAGAAGAQVIGTPYAWPRTLRGFGQRAADQTGFYVLQTASYRALRSVTGWRGDEAPCAPTPAGAVGREAVGPAVAAPVAGAAARLGLGALASCAVRRTFTAYDRGGVRRVDAPLLASIVAATGASVAWRPERHSAGEAWAFVGTRLGVVLAGFTAERLLVEWRRGRGAPGGR
jgi:hypothetical protein